MRLSDLLAEDRIAVPLEARDLTGALEVLVRGLVREGALEGAAAAALPGEVARGASGEIHRMGAQAAAVLVRSEGAQRLEAALGIADAPFPLPEQGPDGPGEAQVLLFLVTPRRLSSLRESFVPALRRLLKTDDGLARILSARSPGDVRDIRRLMDLPVREHLLVQDSLEPLQYRIFPDTPLREAVELMVRRELHAVPVVGEDLGVLGIISVGDALERLLPASHPEADAEPAEPAQLTARDVMTRTVLCVSEDQSLLEAGTLMVNRDVEQLPVVREGELIGFVTREAILRRIVDLRPEDD